MQNHRFLNFMVFYSWTGITIGIKGWEPAIIGDRFETFKVTEPEGQILDIEVLYVEKLPEMTGVTVHSEPEFDVISESTKEHRYYKDLWREKKFALLYEVSPFEKKLYILSEYAYRIESDLQLFNCLAMERTMFLIGRWILHSSFIQTSKGAVLFSAPSGTGKSTQADLWHRYKGAKIINGDRSGIWRESDGVWYAGGVPWWGSSEITTKMDMPLAGIVLLSQSPENNILTSSMIGNMKKMMREISINPWNRRMIGQAQWMLADLCEAIPIVNLACRPDEEAVQLLATELGIV